jgi:hypothetical protein
MIANPSLPTPVMPGELKELAQLIEQSGVAVADLVEQVRRVTEVPGTDAPLAELKAKFGLRGAPGHLERLLLFWAGSSCSARLSSEPIPEQVKRLWQQEWRWMTETAGEKAILLGSPGFEGAAKTATLRRFPVGPMDYEPSGIPRSWLGQTQHRSEAVRLALFIARRLGGFQPLLFLHMGRKPRNRTVILEAEVMKMYHRLARIVQQQPRILGLMTCGWFHDPQALKDNPHLEWLNQPYQEGGMVVNLGLADEGSGVAEGNAARRQSLAEGRLNYRLGLALWPRQAMIEWVHRHPQWADPED